VEGGVSGGAVDEAGEQQEEEEWPRQETKKTPSPKDGREGKKSGAWRKYASLIQYFHSINWGIRSYDVNDNDATWFLSHPGADVGRRFSRPRCIFALDLYQNLHRLAKQDNCYFIIGYISPLNRIDRLRSRSRLSLHAPFPRPGP
jgi:hypothetical protein